MNEVETMAKSLATLEPGSPDSDYLDDYDTATNRLASGALEKRKPAMGMEDWDMIPNADWLLRITDQLRTDHLPDEDPDFVPARGRNLKRERLQALRSSGMQAHTSAVKIVPTRGARFTTGVRRVVLMSLLAALAVGALALGGYLVASTTWVSSLLGNSTPAAPVTAPGTGPQTAPQEPPQQQTQPQGVLPNPQPNVPADMEESAQAGVNARSLRDRGMAAYQEGNYNEAADLLEQSVSLDPEDPTAQYQLGMADMATTGRAYALDDAELAFRTAVSLQPDWAAAYQMLSETFLRRNMYQQAIEPALKATQLDPNMSQAWMSLGRAYEGAGNKQDAQTAYEQAAKLAPGAATP
jgi:tetratricopeptide (TPR) repeat protein